MPAAPITAPTMAELTTQPLVKVGHVPCVVDEKQRTGDDAHVKAGEQAAQRGDGGNDVKPEMAANRERETAEVFMAASYVRFPKQYIHYNRLIQIIYRKLRGINCF